MEACKCDYYDGLIEKYVPFVIGMTHPNIKELEMPPNSCLKYVNVSEDIGYPVPKLVYRPLCFEDEDCTRFHLIRNKRRKINITARLEYTHFQPYTYVTNRDEFVLIEFREYISLRRFSGHPVRPETAFEASTGKKRQQTTHSRALI
ncbi:hypothetical protein WA026_000158 [Henosepilachna vigintioctopunctata]|uniref:Uncharacterized protein n=1 Tax=Henosepilachna vigintioctopunctata TaxID=420089 RepID=A0AAW1V6N4_9CUCU